MVKIISIIVPCHRIIGANGKLTGYAGGLKERSGYLNTKACYKTAIYWTRFQVIRVRIDDVITR